MVVLLFAVVSVLHDPGVSTIVAPPAAAVIVVPVGVAVHPPLEVGLVTESVSVVVVMVGAAIAVAVPGVLGGPVPAALRFSFSVVAIGRGGVISVGAMVVVISIVPSVAVTVAVVVPLVAPVSIVSLSVSAAVGVAPVPVSWRLSLTASRTGLGLVLLPGVGPGLSPC